MAKVKQKVASIIATVSVTGTLVSGFPAIQIQAATVSGQTVVGITLDDASGYGKELQASKNASDYGLCDNVKDGVILHAFC